MNLVQTKIQNRNIPRYWFEQCPLAFFENASSETNTEANSQVGGSGDTSKTKKDIVNFFFSFWLRIESVWDILQRLQTCCGSPRIQNFFLAIFENRLEKFEILFMGLKRIPFSKKTTVVACFQIKPSFLLLLEYITFYGLDCPKFYVFAFSFTFMQT